MDLSKTLNQLHDEALSNRQWVERDYLGASQIGRECTRNVYYGYKNTPKDHQVSAKTARLFGIGHALEPLIRLWLIDMGFDIIHSNDDGEPLGFSQLNGKFRGHVDGIITYSPIKEIKAPCLWECKTLSSSNMSRVKKAPALGQHREYAAQVALYQVYMDEQFPGVADNPALFTAYNKSTNELYHELIPFNGYLAQRYSDRAVDILQMDEPPPKHFASPQSFECKYLCAWSKTCWEEK